MSEKQVFKGKYILKKELSKKIFKCLNSSIDRDVILKKVIAEDEVGLEYEILNKINHEFIPIILDKFYLDNDFYFVENFIEGITLKSYLENNKNMEFDYFLGLMIKLANIISYLHNLDRPIIHRDINPSNILINDRENVFLIDFSSAIFLDYEVGKEFQSEGTVNFFSPEQILIGKHLGISSDIYGFGAVISYGLRELEGIFPLELEIISKKAMEIRPNKRYLSIDEIINIMKKI